MGKIWDRITKKEQAKPVTIQEIEQLKLELEKAKLNAEIARLKQSTPKKGLGNLVKSFLNESPQRRKVRFDNIKRGLDF